MITTTDIRVTYSLSTIGASYSTPFKVIKATHLVAKLIRTSDDNEVTLSSGDYNLSGVGNDSGATFDLLPYESANNITDWTTYDTGPWQLLLTLSIPILQDKDLTVNGRFSEENVEDGLDLLTQISQLSEQGIDTDGSSLNIRFPANESSSTSPILPSNSARLGKLAGWNATTGEFEAVSLNTTGSGMQGPATQVDDRLALFSSTTDLLKDDSDIAASLFRPQTLVYAATINWDSDSGHIATLNLSGNPTLNVTNIKAGSYKLLVNQDVTGGRTITFNTGFGNTTSVTLNTDSSALTVLTFTSDGTTVYYEGSSQAATSSAGDVGTYRWFAYDISGSEDDIGYLICNGQAVSRTKYADLFAALSTTYGVGDGSTTFNLPDLTTGNRFIRASTTAGTTQADATAVNGLSNDTFTPSNTNLVQGDTTFATTLSAGGPNDVFTTGGVDVTHSHTLSGDSETRPINISAIPAIKF